MENSALLSTTNKILSMIGISAKKILSLNELTRVASSMFVAIYESLFNDKIDGVIRNPRTVLDYTTNAQLVIDGLCRRIDLDLVSEQCVSFSLMLLTYYCISNMLLVVPL